VGGVEIPAGSLLLLLYGSANRDDSAFSEPDELVPTRRADHPHLAFGIGPHFCIGANLARTVGRIAVELMLRTFDRIELDPANTFTPDPSYLLHGIRELQLTLTRAAP
jgi:cytochrome P450